MTGPHTETFLMKPGQVRDLLNIGRTTLHEWRVAGRLQAVRHHARGPWLYPADQDVIRRALKAVAR
jgi:predicted site-specific integrase-resolvase